MATSNPILIEDQRFYRLITLSYKYSPNVLRELIHQFYSARGFTFEEFLNLHTHELFHKRQKSSGCCSCLNKKFVQVILEHQWNTLFNVDTSKHGCLDINKCPVVHIAKVGVDIEICDISLLSCLINNIQDLLGYIIDELCKNLSPCNFEEFLRRYLHSLYHSKEIRRCCKCTKDPDGKNSITKQEWKLVFQDNGSSCLGHAPCICCYVPVIGICRTSLSESLLCKIGQSAGPVSVIRRIRNNVLAHSASPSLTDREFNIIWSELTGSLYELLDVITDSTFKTKVTAEIASLEKCHIDQELWEIFAKSLQKWIEHDTDFKQLKEEVRFELRQKIQHIVEDIEKTDENLQQLKNTTEHSHDELKSELNSVTQKVNRLEKEKQLDQNERRKEHEILQESLDKEKSKNKAQEEEFKKMKQKMEEMEKEESQTIPPNMRDQHKDYIKEWKIEDDKYFTETKASQLVLETVKKSDCVVVTGSPGTGKSFLIYHAALQLQRYENYEIIPFVLGPDDIIKYRHPTKNQLFVVDDLCGKNTMNVTFLDMWRIHSDKIEKIVKKKVPCDQTEHAGNVKLVISCRLQIAKDPQFQRLKFLNRNVCNFTEEFPLSDHEKSAMMRKYMSPEMIEKLQPHVQMYDHFPLVCRLVIGKSMDQSKSILIKPFTSVRDDLRELQIHSKIQFCVVAICCLFDNRFNEEWLNPKTKQLNLKAAVKRICKENGIDVTLQTERKLIKEQFCVLEETYVKKVGDVYSLIHDQIYDIAAVLCGEHMSECFIQHSSSSFIGDRYRLESLGDEENDENVIKVSDENEEDYFERLHKDLQNGQTYSMFHNKQLKYDVFRTKMINYCTSRQPEFEKLLKKFETGRRTDGGITDNVDGSCDGNGETKIPLIEATVEGHRDIIEMLLVMKCNVNLQDSAGRTALYVGSMLGHNDCVELLLTEGADVSLSDKMQRTPLMMACKEGQKKIVEKLLENKSDLNHVDELRLSALCLACSFGHIEVAEYLLQRGASQDYNIDAPEGWSPLYVACTEGYANIVELLLKNAVDASTIMSYRDIFGCSPLYMACSRGNTHVVDVLLKYKVNSLLCNKNGRSPLHAACKEGHVQIVEKLLAYNSKHCDNDVLDNALFIACLGGHTHVVETLLRYSTTNSFVYQNMWFALLEACRLGHANVVKTLLVYDTDILVHNNRAAELLHEACRGGHISIIEILLEKEINLSTVDSNGNSPILIASENGHESVVSMLSKAGGNVSICNKEGWSPLLLACKRGHVGVCKAVLASNSEALLIGRNGWSPVLVATVEGHVDILKLLLEYNADISVCNEEGMTSLMVACERGFINIVKLCLTKMIDLSQCNNKGCSPLFLACREGHVAVVDLLLCSQAIVPQCCDKKGCSPLHVACAKGNIDIVKALLSHNADVSMCDQKGRSPLFVACKRGYFTVVEMLLKYNVSTCQCDKDGNSPLFVACSGGFVGVVRYLLQNDANHSICNNVGQSPLHEACRKGLVNIALLLLKNDSKILQRDTNGRTPLHLACTEGHVDVVSLLLLQKADLSLVDIYGWSPLHLACFRGHVNTVRQLLSSSGVNTLVFDKNQYTPLMTACKEGKYEIAELLLQHSVYSSQIDNYCSSLHLACREGHANIVRLLIDNRANINRPDDCGRTPLHVTCEENHLDVVSMLLSVGADISVRDKDNKTALDIAKSKRYTVISFMLNCTLTKSKTNV